MQMSDFGPKTSFKIVDQIREQVHAGELKTGDQIRTALKAAIVNVLRQRGGTVSELQLPTTKPGVVLVVGVNGSGKTTTIGKLAYKFSQSGARVLLAAGDTFRAAAVEQLAEWGDRSGAEVVRGDSDKTRPDAVLYKVCVGWDGVWCS
jgi:fused signal recognition particle receptor